MTRRETIQMLQAQTATVEQKEGVAAWLKTRPQPIQEMVTRFGLDFHAVYTVRDGAPYSFTHPGCVLTIVALCDGGEVQVACWWSEDARSYGDLSEEPVSARIDPAWLEKIQEKC